MNAETLTAMATYTKSEIMVIAAEWCAYARAWDYARSTRADIRASFATYSIRYPRTGRQALSHLILAKGVFAPWCSACSIVPKLGVSTCHRNSRREPRVGLSRDTSGGRSNFWGCTVRR